MIVGRASEYEKKKRKSTGSLCVPIVFFADSICANEPNNCYHLIVSLSLSFSLSPLLKFFTSYILNDNFLVYSSSSSMDNNPLTPRASSFSIASLITSDCCDDENSLYHSMPSPIGTTNNNNNIHFNNNLPVEKITNDYYNNHISQQDLHHFRSATLTETNNGQYPLPTQPQHVTIKENRSTNHKHHHHHHQVTNLQKSLTTIRNMEG
jgi:hypothetical protein